MEHSHYITPRIGLRTAIVVAGWALGVCLIGVYLAEASQEQTLEPNLKAIFGSMLVVEHVVGQIGSNLQEQCRHQSSQGWQPSQTSHSMGASCTYQYWRRGSRKGFGAAGHDPCLHSGGTRFAHGSGLNLL